MPIGYSGAPRVTQNNMDSRLRRLSRSLTTGNNGTPLRTTLFSDEKFQYEASPNAANTNSRRPVMDIFSAEFKDADGAVVNSCVTAGFWNDCGFIELRCAADNTLVWGINNTFGGGPNAILYMSSTGFMKADNTAFTYDENLEQLKVYQNTANTTPMLVLEQDGTGDSGLTFRLSALVGVSMGIDNGQSDDFRISVGNTIGADANFAMNTSAKVFSLGTTTDPRYMLRIRPEALTTQTSGRTISAFAPQKAVSANSANFLICYFADTNVGGCYGIDTGITDSGSREAFRAESYATNPDFQGTLALQRGLFARTGISVGTGTITNSIGLDLQMLESSGLITKGWGVYQRTANADNYFAGNTGIGGEPNDERLRVYRNDSSDTPSVRVEQDGTGDATLTFLLTGGQAYSVGIDNSDADKWRVRPAAVVASDDGIAVHNNGVFEFKNALQATITEVSVNTTLTDDHHTVIVDTSGGARVITLPTASSASGIIYNIKRHGASNVTVDGNGAETIDGAANTVLSTDLDGVTVQSDGTEWWIISRT